MPDSSYVIFTEKEDPALLYSVATDGGTPVLLSSDFGSGLIVTNDSQHVIFAQSSSTGEDTPVFAANPETGETTFLCDTRAWTGLDISADSASVVCLDRDGVLTVAATGDGTPIYQQNRLSGSSGYPARTPW
jgi:hypothetical protein